MQVELFRKTDCPENTGINEKKQLMAMQQFNQQGRGCESGASGLGVGSNLQLLGGLLGNVKGIAGLLMLVLVRMQQLGDLQVGPLNRRITRPIPIQNLVRVQGLPLVLVLIPEHHTNNVNPDPIQA